MLTDDELELLRGRTDNPDTLKAIAALDEKHAWVAKISPFVGDTRVWAIVKSISDTGMAYLETDGFVATDLMGCKPHYYEPTKKQRKSLSLGSYEKCYRIGAIERYENGILRTYTNHTGGVVLSQDGWKLAQPLVQDALDGLRIPFEVGYHCGLTCVLGRHHWERVWTINGVDLPEFDSLLGDFPCIRHYDLKDLPMRWHIVRTEGWHIGRAGFPIRPDDDTNHVSWSDLGDRIHAAAPEVVEKWMKGW